MIIKKNLDRLLSINWLVTLFVNFYYFKFSKAIHLPILIGHKTKIDSWGQRGCIEIEPKFGQLCFGLKGNPFNLGDRNYLSIGKGAKLKIKGTCRFAKGIRLKLFSNAQLSIGNAFTANGNMTISCMSTINIGADCLVGWNVTILDNDGGHAILDKFSSIITNEPEPIIVGNHCWLSSNATLLKGTSISDSCTIGYGTIVVGKKYETKNIIIAGIPSRIVKTDVVWEH